MSTDKRSSSEQRARWPFDPMQPGDHEPARLPEELERVQKQTGHGSNAPSPSYEKSQEKRK
jgi:hypothetical protein